MSFSTNISYKLFTSKYPLWIHNIWELLFRRGFFIQSKDSWYTKKSNSYLVFNELELKVKNSLHSTHTTQIVSLRLHLSSQIWFKNICLYVLGFFFGTPLQGGAKKMSARFARQFATLWVKLWNRPWLNGSRHMIMICIWWDFTIMVQYLDPIDLPPPSSFLCC